MFKGKRHYNEFFDTEENVSTSVLGDKLKGLEEAGLITKGKDKVKKSRIKYSLTEKGIALLPMMVEMILWSATFDRKTAALPDFTTQARKNKGTFLRRLTENLKQVHLSS